MNTYFLCSLSVPDGINKQFERILRQCLWRDNIDTPKQSLASWDMLCKPKQNGGVGIVNFKLQNEALLLKHLDKFYNRVNVPWVHLIWSTYYENIVPHGGNVSASFWWRDIMKLVHKYREVARVKPGAGNTILFWSDNWWFDGSTQPISERFPRLFSYALDSKLSAAEVFASDDMAALFHLPISAQAYEEMQQLSSKMRASPLSLDRDCWEYVWGSTYQASQYYKHLHAHIQTFAVSKWIWKSCCTLKTKFFGWLLLNDRLNTRDMLQRRNWHVTDETHCVLCPARIYEDRLHLFFQCNFSQRIWCYLQIDWSLSQDLQTAASMARADFGKPFFMEVVIIACWNIWKQRNENFFEAQTPSFKGWKRNFVHDLSMLGHRIKKKHHAALMAWIGSLL
jgi:hypothetical protein